jgi:hypothetical protein
MALCMVLEGGDARAAQGPALVPRLLLPGDVHAHVPPQQAEQGWFGLYRAPSGGHELRRVAVTVEETPFGCGGAGRRITASGATAPLFLVAGIPNLREGTVDSAFAGSRFVYPGESLSLQLGREWYVIEAFGAAAPGRGGVRVTAYQLVLRHRPQRQVVEQYPRMNMDAPPRLLWAGDIDRDTRMDLLADMGGFQYALYLSSLAHADSLVGRGPVFRTTTC